MYLYLPVNKHLAEIQSVGRQKPLDATANHHILLCRHARNIGDALHALTALLYSTPIAKSNYESNPVQRTVAFD